MARWKIDYWENDQGNSPVEKWLDKLTKDQFKAIYKLLEMLEEAGTDLKMPHSFPLKDGLFELREHRYGYRIYYCFQGNRLIILLASGDKKSQERDISTARRRLKD